MEVETKLQNLKDYLRDKNILIAFSGGADSSLVAKVASGVSKNLLAVTVDNGIMPQDFIANATKIAGELGIKHTVVEENYLDDPSFRTNPPNRCYICKNKMYNKLVEIARENELEVVDGTNITDLLEDRPGIVVNYDLKIKSPLVKAGFTADNVKEALDKLKIEYSTSTTCMATRISNNSEITPKKINRLKYAESLLKGLSGSRVVRVRDQDAMAILEVENIEKLLNLGVLTHLDSELKAVGFKRVTLDISGHGDSKKELVVYKPCKDEANKIMFETELPYTINIKQTCTELEKIGSVKCSVEMGIAMLESDGRNVTVFKSGKLVARKVADQEDAENLLIEVLPRIRRNI
jgi:pyridinium-3,5-biscarboxylic acid mononucleotide sulfurtransferase